jgi:hypothetical protein
MEITDTDFLGAVHQHLLNMMYAFWCSDGLLSTSTTLLIVDHASG